jgi:hypothetical protein
MMGSRVLAQGMHMPHTLQHMAAVCRLSLGSPRRRLSTAWPVSLLSRPSQSLLPPCRHSPLHHRCPACMASEGEGAHHLRCLTMLTMLLQVSRHAHAMPPGCHGVRGALCSRSLPAAGDRSTRSRQRRRRERKRRRAAHPANRPDLPGGHRAAAGVLGVRGVCRDAALQLRGGACR